MKRIYITNQNREGQRIWFNKIDEHTYTIETDSTYALEYARCMYEAVPDDACIYDFEHKGHKGIYTAFDPSGGPFIGVGDYEIEGNKVIRIYENEGQIIFKTKM